MRILVILAFVLAQSHLGKSLVSLQEQWENFKTTYSKEYKDTDEERYRMYVFEANMIVIEKHNQEYDEGKHTWTMGVNHLADLTHEEFMKRNQLKKSTILRNQTQHKMHTTSTTDLPDYVDWRDRGYVTGVKDQGQCGSSTIFAAIASAEATHVAYSGSLVQLSSQQLMDCIEGGNGCNAVWYDTIWDYMITSDGICSDITYPGTCIFDENDIVATIVDVSEKWSGDEDELTSDLISRPQAVAIDASTVDFQFYSSGVFYSTICSSSTVNHAVFVVGYGTGDGPNEDYYIVKNSWGTFWGENGYIRMSRNRDNNCGIANYLAYTIE